nr:hypothetical protein Iba_chr15bCG1280 [Ipomoea batatas]
MLRGFGRKVQDRFPSSQSERRPIVGFRGFDCGVERAEPNSTPAPLWISDLRRELPPRTPSDASVVPPLALLAHRTRASEHDPFEFLLRSAAAIAQLIKKIAFSLSEFSQKFWVISVMMKVKVIRVDGSEESGVYMHL